MCGYVIHVHKHTLLQAQPNQLATNDTNDENTTPDENEVNIIVDYTYFYV